MLRIGVATLVLVSSASAQFVYDFNNLNGSDPHPFTLLDGQDNWSEQTFNAANRLGVTATRSHDGTQSLQFQEVGPGYGTDASRINDGNFFYPAFQGTERNASFEADLLVGFWGGSFGLAHDTDGSGTIRGSQPGERGVRFQVDTQANVQFRLVAADGTFVRVPVASAGISGGNWVRIRVVMDLTAAGGSGLGYVSVRNITTGATSFSPVPGLQAVPLGLNPTAMDATNPTLWDAMWLHFEGATYGLDNIEIGRAGFAAPYGATCNGAGGPVTLTAQGTFAPGSTVSLVSDNHAPLTLGITVFGFSDTMHSGLSLPFLLDPMLGTSGCYANASLDVTLANITGTGTPATLVVPVTLPSTYVGYRFYVQHVCFEPVQGGSSWSNGLILQVP